MGWRYQDIRAKRFGVIFEASNNERDIFQKILNENINKLINGH